MMGRKRLPLVLAIVAVLIGLAVLAAHKFVAQDACLDAGGSWDAATKSCNTN
jgi:hypothetical protein